MARCVNSVISLLNLLQSFSYFKLFCVTLLDNLMVWVDAVIQKRPKMIHSIVMNYETVILFQLTEIWKNTNIFSILFFSCVNWRSNQAGFHREKYLYNTHCLILTLSLHWRKYFILLVLILVVHSTLLSEQF